MILPLQSFSTLLQNMSAAVQGSATALIDLSVGSVLRALLEASAAAALWMQWLIVQVLAMTRAATSAGADLDSWMADFSLIRLPGSAAAGVVTFSRYTIGLPAIIPVGTIVRSNDALQSFAVTADPANPAWNGNGAYLLAATITSADLPVLAVVPGAAGNVQPGTIGLLSSAIIGVDAVSNSLGLAGGVDPESDPAFRARFQLYINTRSLATTTAIESAISSLRQGLRFAVIENADRNGNWAPGNFGVVVDDGTGTPSTALIASAAAAVDAVRPVGSTFSVYGPQVLGVSIQMSIETSNPATKPTVLAMITQAVFAWVESLPMAGTLAISKLEAIAHIADTSVTSVLRTTINGAASDVSAVTGGVIVPVNVTVS